MFVGADGRWFAAATSGGLAAARTRRVAARARRIRFQSTVDLLGENRERSPMSL